MRVLKRLPDILEFMKYLDKSLKESNISNIQEFSLIINFNVNLFSKNIMPVEKKKIGLIKAGLIVHCKIYGPIKWGINRKNRTFYITYRTHFHKLLRKKSLTLVLLSWVDLFESFKSIMFEIKQTLQNFIEFSVKTFKINKNFLAILIMPVSTIPTRT